MSRPEPPPPPSQPILASSLFSTLQSQQQKFRAAGKYGRIKSGLSQIDDHVLCGGLQRGCVVGVSGDLELGRMGGARLLTLHLLASTLLASPTARASVLDTTGSFPVSLLAKILEHRLKLHYQNREQGHARDLSRDVGLMLERVAITRVFDFEGVWEVLGEVGRGYEVTKTTLASGDEDTSSSNKEVIENDKEGGIPMAIPVAIEEIADSDAEDDDDEEILPEILSDAPPHQQQNDLEKETGEVICGTDILIIDHITPLITDLFSRSEKGAAHRLLSALSHALQSLSRSQNILTILLNTFTTSSASRENTQQQQQQHSVFQSTPHRPSFGLLFSDLVSLSLLFSPVPRTQQDAERFFGGGGGELVFALDVEFVLVLEVLKDECVVHERLLLDGGDGLGFGGGSREQRWCCVEVGDGGLGLKNVGG